MTTYFVSNVGSNTAPYDTEAKAATTLGVVAALPWLATDVVKVSSTHVETAGGAITYTFPTTPGLQVLSVLFNGSGTGALTAGASINVGAVNTTFVFNAGFVYWNGVSGASGTGNSAGAFFLFGNSNSPIGFVCENATFSCPTVSATPFMGIGAQVSSSNDDCKIDLINCVLSQGAARSIRLQGGFANLIGCSLAGTAPTSLFSLQAGVGTTLKLVGCDLSGVAWTNLVNVATATYGSLKAIQCKLRSGFTIATGTFSGPGHFPIELIDCNDGDVNYYYAKVCWEGTILADNTKYANASDGTTPISLSFATSANASYAWPLTSPPISFFNATLSAMTTAVPVAHNGVGGGTGGKLLNSEAWQETLAKVTSGSPIGTWNRADRVANILTAGADQDTDAVTSWTGASIATHDKLESGSFTPAEVGPITTVVKVAKPSVTIYASPNVIGTTGKCWMAPEGIYVNEAAAAAAGGGGSVFGGGAIA